MKKQMLNFLAALSVLLSLRAQEPVYLRVPINSTAAIIPAPNSTMHGTVSYAFESGKFGVSLYVYNPEQWSVLDAAIYRSPNRSELGSLVESLPKGAYDDPFPPTYPGGQTWDFFRPLTSTETADVLAGNWWVVATSAEYPMGEIRAQLLIPEPSIGLLFLVGFWTLVRPSKSGASRLRTSAT